MGLRQPCFVFPVRANALVVGYQVSIAVDRCDELPFRVEKVQVVAPSRIHRSMCFLFCCLLVCIFEVSC